MMKREALRQYVENLVKINEECDKFYKMGLTVFDTEIYNLMEKNADNALKEALGEVPYDILTDYLYGYVDPMSNPLDYSNIEQPFISVEGNPAVWDLETLFDYLQKEYKCLN